MSPDQPQWRLPAGVTRGLWDYVHNDAIAEDYDGYFAANRLFEFDEQVILRALASHEVGPGAVVADLGCGTGRALVTLARKGYRGLGIDLSQRMLNIVHSKAAHESLAIATLRANLVELDAVRDQSVDAAICLFSTLGMIRGKANRGRALSHIHRVVRPGGPLVLHVHNYWYNLYDPGGPWWVAKGYARGLISRTFEPGDKYFAYRGVPNMFLHVFTQREIVRDLRRAGFQIAELIPLDRRRNRGLACPWLAGPLRANGWIVVARS